MARVVTLAELSPPERFDSEPWTTARVEGAAEFDGEFASVKSITLDPVDTDPSKPALRSFTVTTDKAWVRVVWLDEAKDESEPSAIGATEGLPWRPTVAEVAGILRARTYAAETSTPESEPEPEEGEGEGEEGEEEAPPPEDPMSIIAGSLTGEFSEHTRPTATEIETNLIPDAMRDVARNVGRVPWDLIENARRVAALGVAKEVERSYLPEQATPDGSMYQNVVTAYNGDVAALRRHIAWWSLTRRLEAS